MTADSEPLPSQLEVQAVSGLEVTIALMRPGNLRPARTGIDGLAQGGPQTRQGPYRSPACSRFD